MCSLVCFVVSWSDFVLESPFFPPPQKTDILFQKNWHFFGFYVRVDFSKLEVPISTITSENNIQTKAFRMIQAARNSIKAIKKYIPKCRKSSIINKNLHDIRWKLNLFLLLVSFGVENQLAKFWLQSVRQFSSNPIPKRNGVLFWRRKLARWKQLNLLFFW